jgi:hypothetical protein
MVSNTWLRSLIQKTVWSHYNTAHIPKRYRSLYTVVLPFIYVAIGLYGLLSIAASVTSIDLVFGYLYGDMWSIALMIGGFVAFIGISFYARLIWAEAFAACMLVTLMLVYIGCIFTAAVVGAELFRFLSLLLVIIFLPFTAWRVLDITRELRPPVES